MQPRSLRLIHASLIKFGSCHDLTRPSWHGMLLPSGLGKQCLKAPLLLRPGNFVRSPFHTLCHATVPPSAPSSHLTTVSRARTCVSSKPGKPAEKPSQLRPLGILLRDWQEQPENSWSRSLCPTCDPCLSSLIFQDAASLTHRVGSCST